MFLWTHTEGWENKTELQVLFSVYVQEQCAVIHEDYLKCSLVGDISDHSIITCKWKMYKEKVSKNFELVYTLRQSIKIKVQKET